MEKVLKLYKYIDIDNSEEFPNAKEQVIISSFRYDAKRMGGAPTISCSVMHSSCLDNLWTDNVYALFNGEKYFIKQIPTSSYSNTDTRYSYEIELVSERILLDNVYFYDVVSSQEYDKPVSNSSNFTFFGDIHEFALRLNHSLAYSNLDYRVVVNNGISSEEKQVSFQNQFFSNAIQECYNTYKLPYYFDGKVIHIGYAQDELNHVFKYGYNESLLSIKKQNANYKIVNRVTGTGSADNIPYYYPNDDAKGVVELLYNNLSNQAVIVDSSRFRKVKLNDVFVFSKTNNLTIDLLYNASPTVDYVTPRQSDNSYAYTIDFFYQIDLQEVNDISFAISSNYKGSEGVRYEIFKLPDTHLGSFNGSTKMRLGASKYNIIVHWDVSLDFKIENINSDALSLINNYIHASAKYVIEASEGWTLNKRLVSLDDYGIEYKGTTNDGDKITLEQISYIRPQSKLMPPVYRETNGNERFYNALNNTYKNPNTGEFYYFENPYTKGKQKEHIVDFEDVKPTIVGSINKEGLRIDVFEDFAYDLNDNDETEEKDGNLEYKHPYFFGKLRKFDGEFGFNLFDHSIDEDEMVISMTSGSCGSCNFTIMVDDESHKNTVQVDSNGELRRDSNGNVLFGSPQESQNDTRNNEVWIALKKDIDTFGVVMPNTSNNYKPKKGDSFVILHIDLPKPYILQAEKRLENELIEYMAFNNSEKFNFSITFSRIFFAEKTNILDSLNENSRLKIEYDGREYQLYVSSFSYSMQKESALPEILVELNETITITQNALQNAINEVKEDIFLRISNMEFEQPNNSNLFIRKDIDDRTIGLLSSNKGFEVGSFSHGDLGTGGIFRVSNGTSYIEVDEVFVRKVATFVELVVNKYKHVSGSIVLTKTSMKCHSVIKGRDSFRCYFLAKHDGESIPNGFMVGDLARSQTFKTSEGIHQNVRSQYYWREVVGVSDMPVYVGDGSLCHYIDLSINNKDVGSGEPRAGDEIVQLGNIYPENRDRQSAIIMSTVGDDAPSIKQYINIRDFNLDNAECVTKLSPYENLISSIVKLENGETLAETLESIRVNWDRVLEQTDKEFTMWFYAHTPNSNVEPEINWDTPELKALHEEDLFYCTNNGDKENYGKVWRYTLDKEAHGYIWKPVTDAATIAAMEKAINAQNLADSKVKCYMLPQGEYPTPPYSEGDIWLKAYYKFENSEEWLYEDDNLVCVTPKEEDGVKFDISDWQPSSYTTTAKIKTTEKGVEIVNKAFELDEKNKLVVKNESGLVTTSTFSGLFAEAVTSEGEAKEALVSAYVGKQLREDGSYNIESKVMISADNVDINGILNVGENSVSIGGYTVTETNMSAYSEPESIIPNHSITISPHEMEMVQTGIMNSRSGIRHATEYLTTPGLMYSIIESGTFDAFQSICGNSAGYFETNASASLALSTKGPVYMESNTYGGVSIGGLILGNRDFASQPKTDKDGGLLSDFIIINDGQSLTLPNPSLSNGKVVFVKKIGGTLSVPNFVGAKSGEMLANKTYFDNRPYIFISSGNKWYEFYCCWD